MVDIGGGSTELVLGGPEGIAFHVSLDLGCVRLTERFLRGDPPLPVELTACRAAVRALLEERVPGRVQPSATIGVAGTVTTLATLHLGLAEEDPERIHGHRIPAGWIEDELGRLAGLTVEELRAQPGIHPDRAPVLVAGVAVVAEVDAAFRSRGARGQRTATSCTAVRSPQRSCPRRKRTASRRAPSPAADSARVDRRFGTPRDRHAWPFAIASKAGGGPGCPEVRPVKMT